MNDDSIRGVPTEDDGQFMDTLNEPMDEEEPSSSLASGIEEPTFTAVINGPLLKSLRSMLRTMSIEDMIKLAVTKTDEKSFYEREMKRFEGVLENQVIECARQSALTVQLKKNYRRLQVKHDHLLEVIQQINDGATQPEREMHSVAVQVNMPTYNYKATTTASSPMAFTAVSPAAVRTTTNRSKIRLIREQSQPQQPDIPTRDDTNYFPIKNVIVEIPIGQEHEQPQFQVRKPPVTQEHQYQSQQKICMPSGHKEMAAIDLTTDYDDDDDSPDQTQREKRQRIVGAPVRQPHGTGATQSQFPIEIQSSFEVRSISTDKYPRSKKKHIPTANNRK